MKTTKSLSLLALLAVLAIPAASRAAEDKPLPKDLPPFGPDKPLPVPKIGVSKLPNGLTVWLVSRPGFPKATAILTVRGGTAADPKGMEGMSEVLADTVKEGTATRSSKKIAEELQAVGGSLASNATDDAIQLTADAMGSGTPKLIAILADVARAASFPAAEVELAKGNALQNLEVRASTPGFLAQRALAKAVYGDHPYHVVAPTKEIVSALTPDILKKEFARRFRPDRALLVVVGSFDAPAAEKAIAQSFGGWKGAGEAPAATPVSPGAKPRELHIVNRPGSVQSQILLGRPTVKATDPDFYPIVVANTIFGGSFGSRLTHNIREDKGYTYSPGARNTAYEAGGLLTVRADVRNDVTGATLMEMFYELDRMGTTNPTEEEVTKAKRYQSGLYLLRNQIQGAVAGTLASNWIMGLPPEALGEFVPKVQAVTPDQIRKAGRTYFSSKNQTVVVVGDEAKVKGEVEQFGGVTPVAP